MEKRWKLIVSSMLWAAPTAIACGSFITLMGLCGGILISTERTKSLGGLITPLLVLSCILASIMFLVLIIEIVRSSKDMEALRICRNNYIDFVKYLNPVGLLIILILCILKICKIYKLSPED